MPREIAPDVTCTHNSNRKPQASRPRHVSLIFTFFANHPNPRLPQALPQSPRGLCHLMSPSLSQDFHERRRPRSEPRASASGTRKSESQLHPTPIADAISTAASAFTWTLSNAPAQPRRRSKLRRFDVSTFRRFHQKSPKSRIAPTHARHKHYLDPQEACVTLCHLRFCRTYANAAAPRSEPRASASGTRKSGSQSQSTPIADAISTAASAFTWTLSNAPAQPRRRAPFRLFDFSTFRHFDVSTFRLFDVSTQNHPKHEPPQPTPATRLATISARPVSPYVTFDLRARRPRSEPRASASGTRKSGPPIKFNTNRRRNQYRRLCIHLDPLECPRATPPPRTISTFRRFPSPTPQVEKTAPATNSEVKRTSLDHRATNYDKETRILIYPVP